MVLKRKIWQVGDSAVWACTVMAGGLCLSGGSAEEPHFLCWPCEIWTWPFSGRIPHGRSWSQCLLVVSVGGFSSTVGRKVENGPFSFGVVGMGVALSTLGGLWSWGTSPHGPGIRARTTSLPEPRPRWAHVEALEPQRRLQVAPGPNWSWVLRASFRWEETVASFSPSLVLWPVRDPALEAHGFLFHLVVGTPPLTKYPRGGSTLPCPFPRGDRWAPSGPSCSRQTARKLVNENLDSVMLGGGELFVWKKKTTQALISGVTSQMYKDTLPPSSSDFSAVCNSGPSDAQLWPRNLWLKQRCLGGCRVSAGPWLLGVGGVVAEFSPGSCCSTITSLSLRDTHGLWKVPVIL